MADIRRLLLAIITLLSGAWIGLDALKSGAKRAAKSAVTPRPQPAMAGAKGGAIALPGPKAVVAPRREKAPAQPDEKKPTSAPGAQESHADIRDIHGPIAYLKELFRRFNADHCPAWAAALSFFVILSIVPVMLVALAALGLILDSPERAAAQVRDFIAGMLPGQNASRAATQLIDQMKIAEQARSLMDASSIMGIVGIVSLIWAASRIFVNAATPMNAAFRTEETRNFVGMQKMAFGLMLAAGLLFLLSFIPSTGAAMINRLFPGAGIPENPTPFLFSALFFLLALAINAGMYSVVYRFLPSPSANVAWRDAAFGGVIVAILWEIAKQGFGFYLRKQGGDSYNYVSGAAAGVFIGIIWVYYSSMILLLGAEIVEMYRDHKAKKAEEAQPA